MLLRLSWLAILLCLLPILPAAAQELLPQNFNSLTIEQPEAPAVHDPRLRQFYGATSSTPSWLVSQWGMPGEKLAPFTPASGALHTSSAEADVLVQNGVMRLSQNGTTLPCALPSGTPHESDLLFAPAAPYFTPLMPLFSLSSLRQTADITVDGAVLAGKECKVNMGFAVIGIVLVDKQVHPAQVFFYQLELSKVCHVAPGGLNCNQPYMRPLYFFRKNPFGVDEYAPMLGQAFFANGTTVHFSADLLPRLRSVIENGPPGLDTNASHWILANAYYGQHIWGGVTLTTRWSGVHLVAEPKS